jgi:hypothetical protein
MSLTKNHPAKNRNGAQTLVDLERRIGGRVEHQQKINPQKRKQPIVEGQRQQTD